MEGKETLLIGKTPSSGPTLIGKPPSSGPTLILSRRAAPYRRTPPPVIARPRYRRRAVRTGPRNGSGAATGGRGDRRPARIAAERPSRPRHPHRLSPRPCAIAVRFGLGGGLCRNGRDRRRPPVVTPDLFRGPGKPGGGGACGPRIGVPGQAWTPEQVRGDKGGTRKAGESVPQSVSRSGGCAGNPPVPTPCTRSSPSKPDSSGLVPGSSPAPAGHGPAPISAPMLRPMRAADSRSAPCARWA